MGTLQGRSEQMVAASPQRIWAVLEDSTRLPDWVPVVERVTEHDKRESAGAVRRCEVAMAGKRGYIVERCLESIPERKLHHAVDDDSFGFTKMFRDYSFTLELVPRGESTTRVICETFYEPRNPLTRVINALVMRRRFSSVREDILRGLKELVERGGREVQPGDGTQRSRVAPTAVGTAGGR